MSCCWRNQSASPCTGRSSHVLQRLPYLAFEGVRQLPVGVASALTGDVEKIAGEDSGLYGPIGLTPAGAIDRFSVPAPGAPARATTAAT